MPVNWWLRRGSNEEDYYTLSISQEFTHFQIAPLALPYTMGMIALAAVEGSSLLSIAMIIISTHAAWEFLSEILTVLNNRHFYRRCYIGISSVPRRVFWISTGVLALLGWYIAVMICFQIRSFTNWP